VNIVAEEVYKRDSSEEFMGELWFRQLAK